MELLKNSVCFIGRLFCESEYDFSLMLDLCMHSKYMAHRFYSDKIIFQLLFHMSKVFVFPYSMYIKIWQ